MNIILLGPPGCGKGTQAKHICQVYGHEYLSVGNLLRDEIEKQSTLGKKIKPIVESGHMIQDDITNELVRTKIEHSTKLVFDGYPRSVPQAQFVDTHGHIDLVLYFQVADSEIIQRLSNRWMVDINSTQHPFTSKEKADDFAKYHGGRIFRRADDEPNTVAERLRVYKQTTKPLLTYYGRQHKLFLIHGERSIPLVWKEIKNILDKRMAKKSKH